MPTRSAALAAAALCVQIPQQLAPLPAEGTGPAPSCGHPASMCSEGEKHRPGSWAGDTSNCPLPPAQGTPLGTSGTGKSSQTTPCTGGSMLSVAWQSRRTLKLLQHMLPRTKGDPSSSSRMRRCSPPAQPPLSDQKQLKDGESEGSSCGWRPGCSSGPSWLELLLCISAKGSSSHVQ